MSEVHTFCRICESLCGLRATVEGDRVTRLRPDPEHVATAGFACPKGLRQHELYGGPDRLTAPMRRTPDGFVPATWDEALADIGQRVRALRADHHPDAVAMYVGTAAGFSTLHPVFAQAFMEGLGSASLYATASQDCANKFAVARALYGFPFLQPFPDLDHTGCLVVVGANPVISKWSFLQVPNPGKALRARVQAGMKLWFVDPRRTESVKVSQGQHCPIRPGTDVFFFASLLAEIIAQDGVDKAFLARHCTGFEAVAQAVAAWPAARTAPITRVPAETVRTIAADLLAARDQGAAVYSSTGVNMGGQGALAFWLQEVINAATGNLDRRGGTLVGQGILDFPGFAARQGLLMSEQRSRIGDIPKVNDAFPGGVLADEILTPGPRQVKALFVTGGNPLMTMPNAGRLREALRALSLLVVVDVFLTETASEADWVLPATSPLERPDLPFIFPLLLGMQRRPYLQATRAVVPPPGAARDEATIYHDLARACGVGLWGSKAATAALTGWRALARRLGSTGGEIPQEAILSGILRAGGEGSFPGLLRARSGRLRPPNLPGSFLEGRVLTASGKVELGPPELVAALEARLPALAAQEAGDTGLRLISRRETETHNSGWTRNTPRLSGGQGATNHLYVHPEDAARLGLADGSPADLSTPTATVRVPVRLLADLMPGTVALPHGWGHQHAAGLRVSGQSAGVNVNLLPADGPGALDPLSGMARLTGIPVTLRPAAGPLDPRSWSGRPPEEAPPRSAS